MNDESAAIIKEEANSVIASGTKNGLSRLLEAVHRHLPAPPY